MVLLVTSDNEQFTVDREVVERSVLIRNVLEVVGESDEPIPLSNASSTVLRKVLEYCEHHRDEPLPAPGADQDRTRRDTTSSSEWDQKFMAVDREMIMKIITTANYLQLQSLLDLGSQTVANMMKGKTPQEIRKLFNIVNDFTPEGESMQPSPLEDLSATWALLEESLDSMMSSKDQMGLSSKKYMSLYDAVYNYSTAPRGSVGGSSRTGANLMGADLYSRLVEYFAAHLKALCNKSEAIDGEALPQYYVDEWDRYTRGANCVDKVFLYLNKHWVKRERDEGRTTIYPVYTLALVQWKNSLFDPVNQKCTKLANAVLRLVEKQGNGEAVDQDLVRRVTGSFIALGLDNSNQ